MEQEPKTESSNKRQAPGWLKDGLSASFSDGLKLVLVPIIAVTVLGLLSFLFYLNQVYINIQISVPAYLWGVSFLIAMLVVYWNKPQIDRFLFQIKIHPFQGFLWKINRQRRVVGPLCPKCKSYVVESANKKGNAFGMMDGKEKRFDYHCSNPDCKFEHHLEISLEEVIKESQAELIK